MKIELMVNWRPDYNFLIKWIYQSLSSLPSDPQSICFIFFEMRHSLHDRELRIVSFLHLLWFGRSQFYFHIKERMYCLKTFTNDLVFWFCLFWFFHNWYCYLESFRWVTLFLRRCLAERNTRAASVLSSSSSQLRPHLWQSPKIW